MTLLKLFGVLLLGGCAINPPPVKVEAPAAPQWYAPLPHNGRLTDLSLWWQQQGDPLLVQWIEAGQAVSPTIASAAAHIEQARFERVSTGAALAPKVTGSASASRDSASLGVPVGTTLTSLFQASWELDVYGANRAARDGAQAGLEGAQALWHDARVSVAAEIANQYYSLRACQQLQTVSAADALSTAETARLNQISATAGFTAPATAALARAGAAEAAGRVTQQRAACDLNIKALVALTAIAEPDLRAQLAGANNVWPQVAPIAIDLLPADTLRQRPDVFSAERAVATASAAVGSAQAARYPSLTLSGSVGPGVFRHGGKYTNIGSWQIGPLALSAPLYDAGVGAANVDNARASYDEAVSIYRGKVRQAVREVEEALVNLDSTASRADDAATAVEGYRASFVGTESRYRNGLASLVELEEARRLRLSAEIALVNLQQQRSTAWVALYRAAGGGWHP
jgi:NodT family efflux transporter outer membrane factor (OMF) lipoprotein